MARVKKEIVLESTVESAVDPETVFDETAAAAIDEPQIDEIVVVDGVDYPAEALTEDVIRVAARLNGDIYCVEW